MTRAGRRPAGGVGASARPPHLSAMTLELALTAALALVLGAAAAALALARAGLAQDRSDP